MEGVETMLNGKQQGFQLKLPPIRSDNTNAQSLYFTINMPNLAERKITFKYSLLTIFVLQETFRI